MEAVVAVALVVNLNMFAVKAVNRNVKYGILLR